MSRRRKAEKRKINKDPVYKSIIIEKFINRVLLDGKKSLARKIVYSAIEKFAKDIKIKDPKSAFEQALENAKPFLEVKSKRIGGATYQVPIEISPERRNTLAIRWIIQNAKNKKGKSMIEGLVIELTDCFKKQGTTIKKKEDMHRMAEANKAFAHYK